jgi:4-amino-4-deoxy-L-arabinose transferase-like glycosyltransferase
MAGRRSLIAVVLLAAALHGLGITRSILPAQDGLKFIRVARSFHVQPWTDAVRGSDQHPLYPALVALAEPVVAAFAGHGPETWRVAAQGVAALAALALLVPLHGLTRALFGLRIAGLAALGFVLLPLPMAVGHDTLSDSLALLAFVLALRLGLMALGSGRWEPALGCGLAAGLGFLARPEVLVAPLAVTATGAWRAFGRGSVPNRGAMTRLAPLAVGFLVLVGAYALVKGEVSEKLALRLSAAVGPSARPVRKAAQWLPPGLNDPRWDFSPKEEPAEVPRRRVGEVVESLALQWSEGLGGVLAFFAVWGLVRDRYIRGLVAAGGPRPDPDNLGRWLVVTYLGLFALVLVRHELRMGYLSDRHTLALVTLSLPWAAAGTFVCARGVAVKLHWSPRRARMAGLVLLAAAVATGIAFQLKPAHPTRWGHRQAGRWLASNAKAGEAVLDTRGWAAFVSRLPSYDYWHVRQAFTDSRLAYIVVGDDELRATSRRAATLRAVLDYSARPVAGFPERKGGHEVGVWVYRFERPASWEGLRP